MSTGVRTGGRSFCFPASALFATLLPLAAAVHAERLPIRTCSMVDGLPRNQVNHIMQDSRGYVWFCTSEGVSRFDGYAFRNYGESDGRCESWNPEGAINRGYVLALAADSWGFLWIGTHTRVARVPRNSATGTMRPGT